MRILSNNLHSFHIFPYNPNFNPTFSISDKAKKLKEEGCEEKAEKPCDSLIPIATLETKTQKFWFVVKATSHRELFDDPLAAIECSRNIQDGKILSFTDQDEAIAFLKSPMTNVSDAPKITDSLPILKDNEPEVVKLQPAKSDKDKKESNCFEKYVPPDRERNSIAARIQQQHPVRVATYQFNYYVIDNCIVITIQFLNSRKTDYWCFKPDAISTLMAMEDTTLPSHPAMKVLTEFTLRDTPSGPDEPMMKKNNKKKNSFEVRALFTNMKKDPRVEPNAQVRKFVDAFTSFCKHPCFPGRYLYILDELRLQSMSTFIQEKDNQFWRDLKAAETNILEGKHFDAQFMDDDIINIVRSFHKDNTDTRAWHADFMRLLYKDGILPPNFPHSLE